MEKSYYFYSRSSETAFHLSQMGFAVGWAHPGEWSFTVFMARVPCREFDDVFDELKKMELKFWVQ